MSCIALLRYAKLSLYKAYSLLSRSGWNVAACITVLRWVYTIRTVFFCLEYLLRFIVYLRSVALKNGHFLLRYLFYGTELSVYK